MPPHDASNRDSDARSRLRRFVDKTHGIENGRDRPALASCKREPVDPVNSAYDDDDGPITIRWATG